MHCLKKRQGFTLLELAIVLVIIGLIAGAIVMGRSVLQQSQIRGVIGEIDKYTRAIQMFTDKYGQPPGDFNKAVSFWGADADCPATAYNEVPKTATCNGNGDGMTGGEDFGESYEWYRAWQHLANAGMIEGKFSGVGDYLVADRCALGKTVPASTYPGGGYTFEYTNVMLASAENFAHDARHIIDFGSANPAGCITHYFLLLPKEALEIDAKIDDGRPGTGKTVGRPSTSVLNPSCTTTADPATSVYNTSNEAPACALYFDVGY